VKHKGVSKNISPVSWVCFCSSFRCRYWISSRRHSTVVPH